MPAAMPVALDYDTTIIGALELSDNKWCSPFNCLASSATRGMFWEQTARNWPY
jgi:hypothetical protein